MSISKSTPSAKRLVQTLNVTRMGNEAKPRFTGLHVTTSGDILATDFVNRNVKILDQHGHCKQTIGGPGQLKRPWNAVTTPTGQVVVSDPGSPDVKIFTLQGDVVKSFNFVTNFQEPYGLCVNAIGQILVADKGANCVYVYSDAGFAVGCCKPPEEDVFIQWPQYVAVDPACGDVLVTDYPAHAALRLTPGGRLRARLGGDGSSSKEQKHFGREVDAVVIGAHAKSNILDGGSTDSSMICSIESNKIDCTIGDTSSSSNDVCTGVCSGERNVPGLEAEDYVLFHKDADPVQLSCPQGIAADGAGNFLVVSSATNSVYMLPASKASVNIGGVETSSCSPHSPGPWVVVVGPEDGLDSPEALAVAADGTCLVSERTSGLIKLYRYL